MISKFHIAFILYRVPSSFMYAISFIIISCQRNHCYRQWLFQLAAYFKIQLNVRKEIHKSKLKRFKKQYVCQRFIHTMLSCLYIYLQQCVCPITIWNKPLLPLSLIVSVKIIHNFSALKVVLLTLYNWTWPEDLMLTSWCFCWYIAVHQTITRCRKKRCKSHLITK